MKFLYISTLLVLTSSAPVNPCQGWTVGPLEHATDQKSPFSPNEPVVVKWTTSNSGVTNIREVDLFSAKDHQFLHTQYRSYPGVSTSDGQVSLNLSVPLCLQRDGEYYLGVYSSTADQDMNCYAQTLNFKLTPDPTSDFTECP